MRMKTNAAMIFAGLLVCHAGVALAVDVDAVVEQARAGDLTVEEAVAQGETPAEREEIAIRLIQLCSADKEGDMAGLVSQILAATPPEQQNAMVAVTVVAVCRADPAAAPQQLAGIVSAVNPDTAGKIVAAASLYAAKSSNLKAVDLGAALIAAKLGDEKMAAVTAAATDPSTALPPEMVDLAAKAVAAGTGMTPDPGTGNPSTGAAEPTEPAQPAPVPEPGSSDVNIVPPEVIGYGNQTS